MQLPENIPKEHHHKLRQFYRLILSYGDFKHAKLIAQHILDNKLLSVYSNNVTLVQAFNCSMVIAYCRPFSGNSGARGISIPDLPARFLKLLSSEEKTIHELALFDRNKYLAHTDAEAAKIEPVRIKVNETKEMLMPLVVDRLAPFDEQATRLLLSASTKLLNAVVEERAILEPSLVKYFRTANIEELF